MNLKELSQEEIENMSYDDLAYAILNSRKKSEKIIDLFNEIAKLLNLNPSIVEDKIGDFFEMLTLDKRFIMLDDGTWDLSNRHAKNLVIEEDDEELTVEDEDEIEEEEETEEEEDIFYEDSDDDEEDDEFKDLVVIDEDEEEPIL